MTRTIGSYEVVERRRGKGERYVLRQGDERFACRVVEMPADEDAVEDAEQQVRVAATLEHPALKPVRAIFADQGKLVVVWPEADEGKTLGSLIAAAALPPAAAWWVGAQLGGLLAQSHTAADGDDFLTICHGHIEPSTVHVSADGGVKLIGLGLAPLVGNGLVPNETFTAPEQRGGGRVTPRGDLYSIAVLLWSMLTGTVPVEAPTLDEVADRVPEAFHDAFARALEPKVSRRKITAMEFEQWLGDLAVGGQAALAKAVSTLLQDEQAARDEAAGVGVPRRQSSTQRGVGESPAGPPTPRRQSNTRRGFDDPGSTRPSGKSRQPTLLGQATAKEVDAFRDKLDEAKEKPVLSPPGQKDQQPSGIDWSAAAEAAKRPSVPPGLPIGAIDDDLDWGDDEDTIIAKRPTADEVAKAEARLAASGKEMPSPLGDAKKRSRPVTPARPLTPDEMARSSASPKPESTRPGQLIAPAPPLAQSPPPLDVSAADDDEDEATMIARSPLDDASDEIDRAIEMADSALDAMSGTMSDEPTTTLDPPSERMRKGSLLGSRKGKTPGSPRASGPGVPPPRGSRPSGAGAPSQPDLPAPRGSAPSQPGGAKTVSEGGMPAELEHAMVEAAEPETVRRGPQSNEAVSVRQPVVIEEDDELIETIAEEPSVDALKETIATDDGDDLKRTLALDDGFDGKLRAELDRAVEESDAKADAAEQETQEAEPEVLPVPTPEARLAAESEPVLDVTAPKTTSAPPVDSPWSKENDEAERDDARPVGEPISLLTSMLITLVTAAIVMGAGIWWVRRSARVVPPPMPVATAPPPKSPRTPPPRATAQPSATATATGTASAPAPETDPSKLPPTMGYLRVKWSGPADAQVFLFGKSIGKVGEPVEISCAGMQNVRVGTEERAWLSDGRPVKVACQKLTEIEIPPKK